MKNFVKLTTVLFFTATAAFAQTDTTTETTTTDTDVVVVEQPANTTNTVVRKRVRVNTKDVYRNDKVVHTDANVRRGVDATPRNNRVRRDRY